MLEVRVRDEGLELKEYVHEEKLFKACHIARRFSVLQEILDEVRSQTRILSMDGSYQEV